MYKSISFIIVCLVVLVPCAYAGGLTCTNEEAMKAESNTDTLKNWKRVYSSFKRYGHCDDGAISEGYSDKICILLSDNWNSIDMLNKLTSNDKVFRSFIIKHIDATVPAARLKIILENAEEHCQSANKKLCKSISERICKLIKAEPDVTKMGVFEKKDVELCK